MSISAAKSIFLSPDLVLRVGCDRYWLNPSQLPNKTCPRAQQRPPVKTQPNGLCRSLAEAGGHSGSPRTKCRGVCDSSYGSSVLPVRKMEAQGSKQHRGAGAGRRGRGWTALRDQPEPWLVASPHAGRSCARGSVPVPGTRAAGSVPCCDIILCDRDPEE